MTNKTNQLSLWCVIVACIASTGCHLRPNLGPPGTIGMQRTRASMNDPYPSNDLGPPISGVRPLGYERPKSEAATLQGSPFARRGMQGGQYVPTYGF